MQFTLRVLAVWCTLGASVGTARAGMGHATPREMFLTMAFAYSLLLLSVLVPSVLVFLFVRWCFRSTQPLSPQNPHDDA